MLFFYWSIGKDITDKRASSKWGNRFFQNMSIDLMDMIPWGHIKLLIDKLLQIFSMLFQKIQVI